MNIIAINALKIMIFSIATERLYRAPTALLGCSDTGGNKEFRTVLKEDKIC